MVAFIFQCIYHQDCGAGIGRVTKNLLLPLFKTVHLVEQNASLLSNSITYLSLETNRTEHINLGIQDYTPKDYLFDLIWIQWVIGYLNDEALISFLKRCGKGINKNGYIGIKDNCLRGEGEAFDKEDSSVTRSIPKVEALIKASGMEIVKSELQKGFPLHIYPVMMYLIRPHQNTSD